MTWHCCIKWCQFFLLFDQVPTSNPLLEVHHIRLPQLSPLHQDCLIRFVQFTTLQHYSCLFFLHLVYTVWLPFLCPFQTPDTLFLMCVCFCRWNHTPVILPLSLSTQPSHSRTQHPPLSPHTLLCSLSNLHFTHHNNHHITTGNLRQGLILVILIHLSLMKWEMLLLKWELQLFKTQHPHSKWVPVADLGFPKGGF